MRIGLRVCGLAAAAMICLSAPLFAAVQLLPVVSAGITSPVLVTHAGDGSNRLFIVEQGGFIRVLQPGSSTPSQFLDIHTKVLSGGERGLLGLAFHPQYETNGRFFVYYTRQSDGAIVIAEYGVSPDPNVANATEKVLLTIPHPTYANHNGGMLAFGPDGYLYAGVGDGGGSNDPNNNAQNVNVLLGKILRIDINPTIDVPYLSPPTNPFAGATPGLDEIFAYGLRNPWRFSFDRLTGAAWVADVGQGTREEVDSPLVNGGNYGWRVYEGTACTNNDPALCNPANYIFPVFDYTHSGGRCSITGGYVYRGPAGTLPVGTYLYGDYCSGEIFTWNGSAQTVLLDTAMNISSFGEDEQGELYVVDLNGTISRLVQSNCTFSISPTSQNVTSSGGTGSVAVTATAGCGWTAASNASWLHITSGNSGTGSGSTAFSVDPNTGTNSRTGTMTIAGQTFTVMQGAAQACTFAISPTRATYSSTGGNGGVAVTAGAGCNWTAVSNSSWITVTGGSTGSGSGTVTYSVAPYFGRPKNRSGSITIAGNTFSVKQSR